MKEDQKSNRRSVLKSIGIVASGLVVAVPASAQGTDESDESKVSPDFYDGQRVTDGNDDGIVSVYNQPDTDTYDQMIDGHPYGTAQGSAVTDPDSGYDFVEVDWDNGVSGWTIRGGLDPVSTPLDSQS